MFSGGGVNAKKKKTKERGPRVPRRAVAKVPALTGGAH